MSLKTFDGLPEPVWFAPKAAGERPGVTVVSGFLGAGKTTLLRDLVTRPHGLRVALIVNDLNALNLDAELLAGAAPAKPVAAAERVVALGDGCICCSVRDELGDAVVELACSGDYDHVLIEGSGVTAPRPVADLFFTPNALGPRLEQVATLHALVTVVDAVEWFSAWQAQQARGVTAPTAELPQTPDGHRPVFALMVEQVECADILIVNKADLVTPGELGALCALLAGLNPRAELHVTEHSVLPDAVWPGPVRFARQATLQGPAWVQGLNQGPRLAARHTRATPTCRKLATPAGQPTYATEYGLGSILVQRWRAVPEARLRTFFEAGWPGLLRAKGFVWSAEDPGHMGYLSVAGRQVDFAYLRPWAATMIDAGVATKDKLPDTLRAIWREPGGDRRLELVLIGVRLDAAELTAALDEALWGEGSG